MADIVDSATRSRMMSGIRGKNTRPELVVRSFLHRAGLRFRLHPKLPGKPDLILPKYHTAIFVHGCFWHRHEGCRYATTPASNAVFWEKKFTANVNRDSTVRQRLKEVGWRVLVIWSCELSEHYLANVVNTIKKSMARENEQ
ncbi:MAG: very short patch repair endonuclease [Lysobacteraceae bacterium]